MKASCLCLTLGVAPLAICAPVSRFLPGPGGEALDHAINRFAPEPWFAQGSQTVEKAEPQQGFNPHELPPAKVAQPNVLPPLSRHRPPPPAERPEEPETDAVFVPHPAQDDPNTPELFESQTTETSESAIPCHQALSPREHNDVLVVCLVAAFILVVVVMEMWKSLFRRKGAIRLESSASPSQVSFRDTQDDGSHAQNEKRRV
ncbi:hypothetical protein MYCTH_2297809 [Thermothelomyces thermophilus ATCC 42464]|uniref:Uncharacterized protein n=1 Tax=Thermothelomyces thermophilus (strain ATCC 42464 / BCRC 31852 / DSM 1799) TaxID=573729 RepID=G2Q711_THET4|nr:uncharacterized protein MYCTH_2297809 [Thermothelomyces thermophilus ATCC 42464]AEO54791.1 hypothetical protein MYCTH_2297809 [Thermothelomyces thermophilus ATCC 42464]